MLHTTFALIPSAPLYNAVQLVPLQVHVPQLAPERLIFLSQPPQTHKIDLSKRQKRIRNSEEQFQITKRQRTEKKVRFSNVEFMDKPSETTADDWICETEMRRIHNINRTIALRLRQSESSRSYTQSICFLMESHRQTHTSVGLKGLSRYLGHVVRNGCRGLERSLLSEVGASRRRSVKQILALQRKLKKDGLGGTSLAQQLLGEKSLSTSQPLRQLAFRLAQADEYEARRIHAEK